MKTDNGDGVMLLTVGTLTVRAVNSFPDQQKNTCRTHSGCSFYVLYDFTPRHPRPRR